MLFYTPEAEALRAALRDVLGWEHVDAHGGWLIFALPPSELGVHPADAGSPRPEITFLCDAPEATLAELGGRGLAVRGEPRDEGFGIGTTLVLPGGVEVLLYEPRHASPLAAFRA
jgi:hypothetical protein